MKKLFIFAFGLMLLVPSISFAAVHVSGYFKKNGTYVAPHYRSNPDGNPYNNYSFPGNTNPYTGKTATGSVDTYLSNYYGTSSGSTSSSSYITPTYTKILPSYNVSYTVKTWVENNPGASCNQSSFLRARERAECNLYVSSINDYNWNVTTTEFDGTHYSYDKSTNQTTSCQDGYRILYSSITGKAQSCVKE